ncbi:hypothetical protein [Lentzea sp. NPDC092896]|uniref:hypothetical protein n=1 Tax=Lentzea sp. NPDC092896 TaxID=3364127 RepID=UPI003825B685
MVVLADDSAETVPSIYGQALDLIGFKTLRPGPQGCCGGERPVGAVSVVVPLVLAQRVA